MTSNVSTDNLSDEIGQVHEEIIALLNSDRETFSSSNLVIVERQLTQNYQNIRIQQLIQSWFLNLALTDEKVMSRFFVIIEISPKLKGKVFGAPSGLPERTLKDIWTPKMARLILEKRRDETSLAVLNDEISSSKKMKQKPKLDDLSDVVLQIEAFLVKVNAPGKTEGILDLEEPLVDLVSGSNAK